MTDRVATLMANHSTLLQTALQNLKISSSLRDASYTPQILSISSTPRRHPVVLSDNSGDVSPLDSSEESDANGDEMIAVGQSRPGTPLKTSKWRKEPRILRKQDIFTLMPTPVAIRILMQLDIRMLARVSRLNKTWRDWSTVNYVWFLQHRALKFSFKPESGAPDPQGRIVNKGDDTPEYFDPYDKTPRIATLPTAPIPTSTVPEWTKGEAKRKWIKAFAQTLKRTDPNADDEIDPLRVDVSSLHTSGYNTPSGRVSHVYAGTGSGRAGMWTAPPDPDANMTSTERKVAARLAYRVGKGRKARGKNADKALAGRDKSFATLDDGRFDAPW